MAKRKSVKTKYIFTKVRVITFVLVSIILCCVAFAYKKPIETFVNKESNNVIDYNGLIMHTIDVGQAEAIMIKLPDDKNLLVDSGNTGKTKNENLKSYLINNYFKQTDNKIIDYFIITHSDSDHCGGATMIFNEFQVNKVFRPNIYSSTSSKEVVYDSSKDQSVSRTVWSEVIDSMYDEPNCEVVFSKKGIEIVESEYSIKFYSPTEDNYSDVNSYSPIVVLEYKNRKIMLTGDATTETEMGALSSLPDIDILKVAHHGSRTSTCSQFLQKVQPEYAIISCNSNDGNNYGHPHQETLNKLMEYMDENDIYRTDLNGNIVLNIDNNSEIKFVLDVQGNTYYIKVEYLLVGSICILFIFCFAFNKKKANKKG